MPNFRNPSVNTHRFAMVTRGSVPRSSFRIQKTHKTTFDAGWLIPIYWKTALPGDTFHMRMSAFCRLATPLTPFMDNLHLDVFWFFIPMRLVWLNWQRFMGEQANPADSISFTVPQMVSPSGGYAVHSLHDYYGLPTVGQVGAATFTHSSLPIRCYPLVFNTWFRDENLQLSASMLTNDGPDTYSDYILLRRGKRHDNFTSLLPWPQKGGVAITLPLGTSAPVRTQATDTVTGAQSAMRMLRSTDGGNPTASVLVGVGGTGQALGYGTNALTAQAGTLYPSNLYADLTVATAATINQFRQAYQIQRFLESDARGGTRYVELMFRHFGVRSPDARLQRPEFLGSGSHRVDVAPVPQTSNTPVAGTPQGNLAAFGAVHAQSGFHQSFTEHGIVLGLASVRADLTYQQGLKRDWSRLTRFDFPWPDFSELGEQAVLSKEIFLDGSAGDNDVMGYQPRYEEERYDPSMITGLMRSTSAGTLDRWHLAQRFMTRPVLNATFIVDDPPVDRVIAVPAEPHFIGDFFFDLVAARPLPLYGVPGLGPRL